MEQRLPSKVLKSIAIIGILIAFGTNYGFSQSRQTPITSDTIAPKKETRKFSGFFKRLFQRFDKSASAHNKKNNNKADSTAKKDRQAEPFELTKGSLSWTNLYTRGINLNTGIGGLYSLARLTQGFDVYGVPITGEGTGVFNNGQFEKTYSSYSVNFDAQNYSKAMKKRAEDLLLNKRSFEKPDGKSPNFPDSLNEYEKVRKQLTSPSYQTEETFCRKEFKKEEDSAKKNPNTDTTKLHKLRMKMTYFERMEKRYHQLFEIKKNYNRLVAAKNGDKNIEQKYSSGDKSLNNPDNVEKVLSENGQLKGYEKVLMGLQKFSIGQSGEEISEFTFHNFMMNGLNAGYRAGNIYSDVGYGKQIAVVNPYLMTGISVPNYYRTVAFIRTGLGGEENSNIYVTIIKISDPGNATTLGENNWIFDLSKKLVVYKNLEFEGEFAKSSISYSPGSSDNVIVPNSPTGDDFAYALRGKGTISATNTILKLEFAQTGKNYATLGNPYLLSGANIFKAELSQPVGNKFFITVGGDHIIQNQMGVHGTDNWMDFSVRFKPTRLITMEFKYAPRQLQQQEGTVIANSTTSNINQISFTGNMTNRIWGKDANSTVFIGNFQYVTQESSLLLTQNLNLSYYMVNEVFMFSPSNGINISADESRNNWTGCLSQFISEAIYTVNIKKTLTLGAGPQWVEQPGVMANGAGLIGSINKSLRKWGRIGILINYRNNIDKPFGDGAQWLVSGNISVLW